MPTFDKINYQKVFPLGMYINERVGVEMSLSHEDNPMEVLATAKELVEQFHKENNKGLYLTVNPDAIPEVQQPKAKLSPTETYKQAISRCTSTEELATYLLIVKNNPDLQTTYDNQWETLLLIGKK